MKNENNYVCPTQMPIGLEVKINANVDLMEKASSLMQFLYRILKIF